MGRILFHPLEFGSKHCDPINLLVTVTKSYSTMAGQEDPNQPRQPNDLEGLLKFCMQATQSEDAPTRDSQNDNQMDPERLQWLQEAMSGMTVDVVSQLVEGIKILSQPYVFDPNATDDEITVAELSQNNPYCQEH